MANDSTNTGPTASEQDMAPANDGFFTHTSGGEDAFFGPEQLAQANAEAPVVVPVPQDQNVIRVQVNPGEILELSSPFDPGAALLGREADGNLAIKVGDVTVILMGFVEANATAPVVVETSDGKPIDIATLLASTDPATDIQTAAGPGDAGQGGQGADNTGAILALLQAGNGLGGLNAVGIQDQTQLSYGNIDNSIRLDRADDLLGTFSSGGSSGGFAGIAEPFLRDPAHTNTFFSFDDFKTQYAQYIDDHKADKGGWADFTGTQATTGDSASFFLDTSFVVEIPHSSTTSEQLGFAASNFFHGDIPTSNGETLTAEYLGSDRQTIVLVRPSDGAVIMVFHVQEHDSTGSFHVEVYLVNRLDHHNDGQDVLSVGFNTEITPTGLPSEGQETPPTPGPTGTIDILDDVPIAQAVEYTSYLGKDAESEQQASSNHGHDSTDTTADGKGYVDEDWLKSGNKDTDNNPSGANSDAAHGDDIGRATAKGNLNINFGADGPSGADGNDCTFTIDSDNPPALRLVTSADAGFVDANGHVLDSKGNVITSHGHELVILSDTVDSHGIEHLIVGYTETHDAPTTGSDLLFASESEGGSCDVAVFELTLDINPDDNSGNGMHFQDFKFELFKALDQDPDAPTVESNTDLQFKVIGQDDDGDTTHTIINIQVNDDSPTFLITYHNEDPQNCDEGGEGVPGLAGVAGLSGGDDYGYVDHYTTKDYGHVDEDWLNGGVGNGEIVFANGPGNHDQDGNGDSNAGLFGDDKGGLEVCGQIKIKYGADGPSDAPGNGTLALKHYDMSDEANPPPFVNGDGSHLFSDGKELVVFISEPGHLQVGVAGYTIPAHGEVPLTIVPGQIVFDLTLDPSTGKFDFQLYGAIDHDPTTADPESNLLLSFDVGAAEDFDHDTALGAIKIQVNDDKPEVGITYCNELPGEIFAFAIGGATQHDTDFGRIDEDWLQGAGNNGTLITIGNQDRDYFGAGNANEFGDDYGSDHLSGQINMKYGADGPGSQTIGLATLSGDFKDADGQLLFSDGHKLVVLSSGAGLLTVGYGETTVFTLTLTESGHFDFKQSMPLDHPIESPIEDNINLAFKAGSITDGDGDTVNAVIKIQVNDDVPETGVTYSSAVPEVAPDTVITYGAPVSQFGQIDEDFLPGTGNQDAGNQDKDNTPPFSPSDPARGDELGGLIVTGGLGGTKYGADGPDGTPGSTFVLTELTAGNAFNDADGNQLKSHGNLLVVLTSDGQTLDVGYHNGSDPDTVVFTLTMTGPDGFEFELKGPLDEPHVSPKDGGKLEDGLVLAFGAENEGAPTDKDGDPAARIVIHVNDDAPKLCGITYTNFTDATGEETETSFFKGKVDEDNLTTGQGNLDTDNDPRGNSDPDRGDTIGSAVTAGKIKVDFGADGPADNAFTLDTYKVGKTFKDACGETFESHGHTLKVLEADAEHISVGYKDKSGSTTVFEFHVNQDGTFSFILDGPLDHPENYKPLEDGLPIAFNVTATDFDGDAVCAKVNICVNDDAPGVGTVTYSDGSTAGLIDEDFVAGGNSDADGGAPKPDIDGGADTDKGGGASVSGIVSVAFGADGPAAHPYSLEILTPNSTFTDATGPSFTSRFDATYLVVISSSATELVVGHDGGSTVFTLTLDQDTGEFTFTLAEGLDQPPFGDNIEEDIPLAFNVLATDYDGDSSTIKINISVNDDRPVAVDDVDPTSAYQGNVLSNDVKGADDARVKGVSTTVSSVAANENGDTTITGALGLLIMHANGDWTYTAAPGTEGGTDAFTYTVTDGDGDTSQATLTITVGEDSTPSFRLASLEVGPTHEPAPHYDHEVTVTGINGIAGLKDTSTYHFEDATGGHVISGGAGNDFINVSGTTGSVLGGNGGDDIIHGGDGKNVISGGAGDDTLFGGTNADSFFGGAGHDAMSGGGGNDTFNNIDADDLDGTNTLDGIHSIDGGAGTDTADLSGLKTFDSNQAMHLENVEHLALDGKASGGGGTTVTLNYDAAYGITEVGGLHALSITGDKADSVQLQSSSGFSWAELGDSHVYEAGVGASKVTVTVDHDVTVALA